MTGKNPMRRGSSSSGSVPGRNFPCSEGTLTLQAGAEDQFRKLCRIVGLPHLPDDPRFTDRRARIANEKPLMDLLAVEFEKKSAAEWYELLRAEGVYAGPLNTVSEGFEDAQVVHRGVKEKVIHPKAGEVSLIANPIRFSRSELAKGKAPPLLGEDTEAVLREIGFDAAQIRAAQGLESV